MWNVCCRALFCIGYFSFLTTCPAHSLIAIYSLYSCSCGKRNFNAAVLHNASTFHISNFISTCLCQSRRRTVFLSFSRGLSWGFETALYYVLRLPVPSSNPQHGGSGKRLCLILPMLILPTHLPTYLLLCLSTRTCLHTYLFIYLHTYSALLIICLFQALYLFSYLVFLCAYSIFCFSFILSPALPFLLSLPSQVCCLFRDTNHLHVYMYQSCCLALCTADSSWGCLSLWCREPLRSGCARSVG